MSLLTIARGLAQDVGLAVPDQVIGSPKREMIELRSFADATGEELARRVDWGQLQASTTLTGDGTQLAHALPAGFSRIAPGAGVVTTYGIARPLTQAEWGTLAAVAGEPRYFLLRDNTLRLWPHLATGSTVTVNYVGKFWCSNGSAEWAADDDASLIDEALFLKGLIVRWRRQKGMDFADHEAEFEAALADLARFNDRSRF